MSAPRMKHLSLLFPLFLLPIACSSSQGSTGVGNPPLTSEEDRLIDDGTEANGAGDTASAVVSIPAMVITKPEHVVSAATAATVAVSSKDLFLPEGCVTATQNGNDVTYGFAACTGPLGLLNVGGTITASFTTLASPAGVEAHVVSTGLTLDGVAASLDGTIDISFVGTTRTITWSGAFTGKTPRGYDITHTVDGYVLTQDLSNSCITLDGTATSVINRPNDVVRTIGSKVVGYDRCGSRLTCPIAGGAITLTQQDSGAAPLSLTVEFDGGKQATIVTATKSVPITLGCDP